VKPGNQHEALVPNPSEEILEDEKRPPILNCRIGGFVLFILMKGEHINEN
jgi:hypothetical protein